MNCPFLTPERAFLSKRSKEQRDVQAADQDHGAEPIAKQESAPIAHKVSVEDSGNGLHVAAGI